MTFADALAQAVTAGDLDLVERLLRGRSEVDRRTAVDALKAVAKQVRVSQDWRRRFEQERALRVARIGTTPGAAAVAPLLRTGVEPEVAVRVLIDRDPPWISTLIDRVLELTPPKEDWLDVPWMVAEGLRSQANLPRPVGPRYLVGLGEHLTPTSGWGRSGSADSALERLRREPDVLPLVPALLRSPGLSRMLSIGTRDKEIERGWAGAIQALVGDGTLDRDEILDAVLDGLLSGGNTKHISGLSLVLDLLAPTPDEIRARARLVQSLVASPNTALATRALKMLIAADQSGPLAEDVITSSASIALGLDSKQAASTALGWLDKTAKRGGNPDALAATAAIGFSHSHREVQERALTLALRLADRLTEAGRAEVASRVADLDPSLLAQAAPLGAEVRPLAEPAILDDPSDLLAPLPPPQPPASSLAEFVELLLAALSLWEVHERLLDAAARFGHQREAVLQGLEALGRTDLDDLWRPERRSVLADLLPAPVRGRPWRERLLAAAAAVTEAAISPGPTGVMRLRAHEVRGRIATPSRLLAYPDTGAGHVDPRRLVDDLAAAARAGTRFGPLDLEQAWLRLPTRPWDFELPARLAGIGSPDARWIAERVARGPLPPPVITLRRAVPPGRAGFTTVRADADYALIAGAGGRITHQISRPGRAHWHDADALSRITPSQREAVAAYLQYSYGDDALVALLPHLHGPSGMATALAVGTAATATVRAMRTAATDAILGFVALESTPDRLEPWLLGRVLADLLDSPDTKLGRWKEVLATVERTGHHGASFAARTLHPLLEVALTRPDAEAVSKRPGFADLLDLTTRAVRATGVRFGLAGLEALVNRGGSSRAVKEGTRLRDALNGR